jgi:peptide-methionine (S)-S-oxide reductase
MPDAEFLQAVAAIQAGDVPALAALLDAHPRLVRDRLDHDYEYGGYFLNPRLLWFVADNPNLIETMPANSVAVAEAIIARGVDRDDLDYTLELVMTSRPAREQGHQRPLMDALLAAGATASPGAIAMALAHRELDAVQALLERGQPVTPPIAAAFGRPTALPRADVPMAFTLAVINQQVGSARAALDAGADVNAYLELHAHSTALHQAALQDDVPMVELLLARGARLDIRDTIHQGTPLGWALHDGRPRNVTELLQRAATSGA